jgi:hypothetical protein
MSESIESVRSWVKAGIISGLLVTIVYPLLITVSMPLVLTVVLAGAFGPLLSAASVGLYQLMAARKRTVTLQLAVIFNVIAGTLVTTMLIVQMTLREFLNIHLADAPDPGAIDMMRSGYSAADKVQLGLDVAWDIYIALGTVLFALNMLMHPRFGRVIGVAGILIGVLLLGFNLGTFPAPPAEAGSIDFGPLVGLWYLAVAILMIRAFPRISEDMAALTE